MFVFGHAGLTVTAAHALDRETDLRWAAALSLAPDFLDKPLSKLVPALVHHNTRSFGHTLVFSLCVLAALLIWKRHPKAALVLWGCYTGHFLLDGMWLGSNPAILFWPMLGAFPPPVRGPLISWHVLYNLLGEIAGLIAIFKLARRYRLSEQPKLDAFLISGRLP